MEAGGAPYVMTDEEREIYLDYKTWKKNTPVLYDLVVTHALDVPSITCDWFPDISRHETKSHVQHRLILGTGMSENPSNYLIIAKCDIPILCQELTSDKFNSELSEYGNYGFACARIEPLIRINHHTEINRARCMPQKPQIIATKPAIGDVYVFDYTKHPSKPDPSGICNPQLTLKGHSSEGFGLSWNSRREGLLLSSAEDKLICLWDINDDSRNESNCSDMLPLQTYSRHKKPIGEVKWHRLHPALFGSASDDASWILWDERMAPSEIIWCNASAHTNTAVNSLDFNYFNEMLVATSGADHMVEVWDLRKLKGSVTTFKGHTDDVLQVQWSPHSESLLASTASDRCVIVWDMQQQQQHSPDDDSGMVFNHCGHTDRVFDFQWNPNVPKMMASSAEDSIVQIWKYL